MIDINALESTTLGNLHMNIIQTNYQPNNFKYDLTAYDDRMPDELICSARRNRTKLVNLINRLFEHHSRMLAVRIDLSYKQIAGCTVTLEMAQMHRQRLLEDRRGYPEFENLLGYAWCLEEGQLDGSYHFHLLAFYHGADRRCDIGIGLAIRDLWDRITHGLGKCHISNLEKEKLDRDGCLGIGMIKRNDVALRINLIEKVATYIAKKCKIFDIHSGNTRSGAFRTFGTSQMPPPLDPNVPRRGRPPVLNGFVW